MGQGASAPWMLFLGANAAWGFLGTAEWGPWDAGGHEGVASSCLLKVALGRGSCYPPVSGPKKESFRFLCPPCLITLPKEGWLS